MSRGVQKLSGDVATLLLPSNRSAPPKRGLANSFQDVLKQSQPAAKQQPTEKPASPKSDADPRPEQSQDNQPTETDDTDHEKKTPEGEKTEATNTPAKVKTKKPDKTGETANDDDEDVNETAQSLALADQVAQVIQKTPDQVSAGSKDDISSDNTLLAKAIIPATPAERPAKSDEPQAAPQVNANVAEVELPDGDTAHSEPDVDEKPSPEVIESPKTKAADPDKPQVAFKEQSTQQVNPEVADKPVEDGGKPAVQLQKPVEKKDAKAAVTHDEQEPELKTAQPAQSDSIHSAAPGSQQAAQLLTQAQNTPQPAHDVQPYSAANTQLPPQPASVSVQDFAATNRDKIVTSMRSQLLPNGGTMRIQLDPPQLGSMEITVKMIDGAMTASFQTSSDQATQVLSHSLGQLKQALETQGISVEKLHVEQTPKDQQAGTNGEDRDQRQSAGQDSQAQRDQQRREILERMWRRLQFGSDPLDMVA